jgi:hypothetical protein
MERNTQIWVGVVVLAALAGGVWYKAREDAKVGTSTTTAADLPELKAPDDTDKIVVKNGDKPEIVLEKKGDKWELVKPVGAPANQTTVKSTIDNLKELKAKEVVVAQPNDDQKKEFEFTPEKEVHVQAFKGGDKKLDAFFGRSGARGQMAMVEGKPSIYAVSGYSSYLYQREPKGWRDTEILKFDDANANQVTIEKKKDVFSFTKGDKWAGTLNGKPIERFDDAKVADMLRSFKALNAEDFGDGKSAADTGLDEPEAKVTIQLKDNAAKYVLKVGKVSTGTSHYIQKEGDPTTFVIAQYQSDWALDLPNKVQQPADAGADKKDAGKK